MQITQARSKGHDCAKSNNERFRLCPACAELALMRLLLSQPSEHALCFSATEVRYTSKLVCTGVQGSLDSMNEIPVPNDAQQPVLTLSYCDFPFFCDSL